MKTPPLKSLLAAVMACLLGAARPPQLALGQTAAPAPEAVSGLDERLVGSTLVWFSGKSLPELQAYLKRVPALQLNERARADAIRQVGGYKLERSVNPTGKKYRSASERIVRQLTPVVDFYGTRDIRLLFYEDKTPYIALSGSYVLCISTGLLDLMKDDGELQGLFAHEVAHKLVAYNLAAARQAGDWPKVREQEQWCDGAAVVTLLSLGRDPEAYPRAIRRLADWHREHGKPAEGPRTHPTPETRAEFCARLIRSVREREAKVAQGASR
jgi:hypothetical protein